MNKAVPTTPQQMFREALRAVRLAENHLDHAAPEFVEAAAMEVTMAKLRAKAIWQSARTTH